MVFSAIPQVVTEGRASGAQFIDGSLTINGSNQYLTRTNTASNTKTWSFSCWVKKQRNAAYHQLFTGFSNGADQSGIIFMNDDTLRIYSQGGLSMTLRTSAVYRDSGWMNVVVAVDTTIASPTSDRVKLWVNGTRVTDFGTATYPSQNDETYVNKNITHYVGSNQPSSNTFYGQYAQAYFIDGQALGAGYFGFTDPLTGTWRPKKFRAEGTTVNDGTVWSDLISAGGYVNSCGPTKAFDGSIDSSDQTDGCKPADDDTATLTLGTTIHGKIRAYFHRSGSGNVDSDIAVDGIGVGSNVNSTGWYELPVDSLRTLSWKHRSGVVGYSLQAIEVDGVIMRDSTTTNLEFGTNGFYLPMDGNSPIGEDKSGVVTPNDGTTWSDLSSATNITAGNVAGFFQGNTSSCSSLSLGTSGVFLLTKDIPNVTKIGVHSNTGASFTMKVNEGLSDAYTVTVPSRNNVSILDEFTGFTGTIHTLSFSGFGAGVCLNAIEINGHLLVDGKVGNNWTAIGCGSVDLPKATGAIPVLNTNDAGTVAKRGVRTDKKTKTVTASGGN